jgi:SulP family sulfate permease
MNGGRMPKLFETVRGYNLTIFAADLVAGITVGLVALPLAMAFAISSGVSPEAGLYCAVVAGFLISSLGGSTLQIGGPTGAFVVIIYAIVAEHGFNALLVCTIMAGLFLVVLGLTGLGSAVKFIPRPVSGCRLIKYPANSWAGCNRSRHTLRRSHLRQRFWR